MNQALLTSTSLAMFPLDAKAGSHIWRLSLADEHECSQVDLGLFEQTCLAVNRHINVRLQTRRDSCSHFLQRLDGESGYVSAEDAQQCVLYCASGELILPDEHLCVAESQVHVLDEVHEKAGIAFSWSASNDAVVYLARVSYFS